MDPVNKDTENAFGTYYTYSLVIPMKFRQTFDKPYTETIVQVGK